MACYEGAAHLAAQLASLEAQSHADWSLDASDDGSTDGTADILQAFRDRNPDRVRLFAGPRRGAAAAFLTLAERAVADAPGAALAFCDQDDVWMRGKLARALRRMAARGDFRSEALAYASRTILTDARLHKLGLSHLHARGPSFPNALVQNILGGNTIVLSPKAAEVLARSVPAALHAAVPYHDWWVYLILSGYGATIDNDSRPGLYYRQHGTNQLGHHGPVRGRLRRLGTIARRQYSRWLDANFSALTTCDTLLSPENSALLAALIAARQQGGGPFSKTLQTLGIHRQTSSGDRMLQLMARTGRL